MNNKIKFFTILIVSIIAIIGGIFVINQKDEQSNTIYNDRQKERIQLFIEYNFENVEDIEFTDVEESPMGGLFFNGIINKKITFHGTISTPGEDFENTLAGINGEFFDKNIKTSEDGAIKITPVSKILEEQSNNK